MKSFESVQDYASQFGEKTFTACIEERLRQRWTIDELEMAMRGTYAGFPESVREDLDRYLQDYIEKWIVPEMQRQEMRIVFLATSADLGKLSTVADLDSMQDTQIIDAFNIMLMKITRLASLNKDVRRMWKIKKSWWDGW